MQTKTYFASSVPAALEAAREELGENALLIRSRPAPLEARQFGRLEVTFACEAEHAPPRASEMEEIRQQLSALRAAVIGRDAIPPENGATLDFVGEMAAAVRRSGNPEAAGPRERGARIPVAPFVDLKPGESRMLAVAGPPGRGKTTSLVKIAVRHGLARRVPVRIYCAGSHAIGAHEQMARYAAILGVPWQACESLASLNLALNGDAWKGLLLIDTPGISPADQSDLEDLRRFFAARPEIEKHLVLRADTGSADLLHTIKRFSCIAPSRLLFTGADEAVEPTPMVEALIQSGIPGTFCGTGQRVPEDLEEINAERLMRVVRAGKETGTREKFARAAA